MDQKLFVKITHHAYAPEYLSSYAYENISQKESNAVTNRASGCYLEVPEDDAGWRSQGWLETTRRALSR